MNGTRSIWSWVSLIFLGIVWGASYLFIKKALIAFSPVQTATIRLSIAGIAFLPIAIYHIRKADKGLLKWVATVGFVGSFIPFFLFAFGQTKVGSALAGVLSSLTPIFTLLVGVLFFKQKGTIRQLFGVVLGLLGAIWLVLANNSQVDGHWFYGGLIVLGALLYGFSSNIIHTKLKKMAPVGLASISFVMIGIPSIFLLFTTSIMETLTTHPHGWASFYYLLILALVGTFVATMIFFHLVQKEGAVFSTMVGYFFPIVATFLGFFDGEILRISHIAGMSLILAGVYILRREQ